MSINQGTWPKVSRWSDFRKINLEATFFQFSVALTTRSLTLPDLSPSQQERLLLITGLFKQGFTASDIADYLNRHYLTTPHGKMYYPELVWVTNKKFTDRLDRLRNITLTKSEERLVTPSMGDGNG